jgi:hypothetical protein
VGQVQKWGSGRSQARVGVGQGRTGAE